MFPVAPGMGCPFRVHCREEEPGGSVAGSDTATRSPGGTRTRLGWAIGTMPLVTSTPITRVVAGGETVGAANWAGAVAALNARTNRTKTDFMG